MVVLGRKKEIETLERDLRKEESSAGLRHNKYWNAIQSELALDDLFVS